MLLFQNCVSFLLNSKIYTNKKRIQHLYNTVNILIRIATMWPDKIRILLTITFTGFSLFIILHHGGNKHFAVKNLFFRLFLCFFLIFVLATILFFTCKCIFIFYFVLPVLVSIVVVVVFLVGTYNILSFIFLAVIVVFSCVLFSFALWNGSCCLPQKKKKRKEKKKKLFQFSDIF